MSHLLFTDEDHTAKCRVYRPNYPEKLFEHILDYYFDGKNTNEKIPSALDVGCGSGQATVDLSRFCERVIGIDVSENQITNAIPKDNVEYRSSVKEVQRVLKPQTGVFAVWAYAFGTLDNPAANAINYDFFHVLLFPYWNEKQYLVNEYYQSLVPRFPYQSTYYVNILLNVKLKQLFEV